jgi:DNA-binding transcriptional MerR regulator
MVEEVQSSARPVYSIGAVSRMVGVPTSTLRSWEERYGVVVPHRSSGGQRLYSRDQVHQLTFVARQVDAGLQAGEAHRLLEMGRTLERPREEGVDNADRRRVLILLAERDRFAAELSEYLLRTEGFEVIVAFDAAEAASISEEVTPDLALVELLISGGGGTELCRQLTERRARVLATSVLDLREEALAAGADAFLPKPFEPLQLVSTVRDLLGASALVRPTPERTAP